MDARHPPRQCVHKVATYYLQSSRMQGDMLAYEVEDRLLGCIDLVAAKTINFSIMTA